MSNATSAVLSSTAPSWRNTEVGWTSMASGTYDPYIWTYMLATSTVLVTSATNTKAQAQGQLQCVHRDAQHSGLTHSASWKHLPGKQQFRQEGIESLHPKTQCPNCWAAKSCVVMCWLGALCVSWCCALPANAFPGLGLFPSWGERKQSTSSSAGGSVQSRALPTTEMRLQLPCSEKSAIPHSPEGFALWILICPLKKPFKSMIK